MGNYDKAFTVFEKTPDRIDVRDSRDTITLLLNVVVSGECLMSRLNRFNPKEKVAGITWTGDLSSPEPV
jgi:hypothetical protein